MITTPIRIVLSVFGVASGLMVLINLLTDRHSFWAIWPIWGFSMIAGVALGLLTIRSSKLLGIWAGFGISWLLGLLIIDISNGGNWWFFWPLGVWLVFGLVFIGLTVDILGTIPTSRPLTDDDDPTSSRA